MIRPLSDALFSGPAVPRLPAWARKTPDPERPCDAAARAGAALCTLHAVIGSAPPWAGVWRDRLALAAAQKSCRRLGRSDDEASLREAFLFRPPEAAPSPAERVFLGWQQLALPEALAPPGLRRAAAALGYVGPLDTDTAGGERAREYQVPNDEAGIGIPPRLFPQARCDLRLV